MNGMELRKALRAGHPVYGTLITSPSPFWVSRVQTLGLDWVFIDTEHIPLERSTVAWMCQAYAAHNIAPIVRIPQPDVYRAQMALDGGAAGIIVPYVESVAEVTALAGVVRWGPLKGRKLDDLMAGRIQPDETLQHYMETRNHDKVLIVQVESIHAVENLGAIVEVSELDAILIGPHDLSISLDIPEQYTHPVFQETVLEIIRKARDANLGVGVHFGNVAQEQAWLKAGANLISHSSDISTFLRGMSHDLEQLKGVSENTNPPDNNHVQI